MYYESTKRAIADYQSRQAQKGVKKRAYFLTDEQNGILRVFEGVVKKIENLSELEAVDVSDDMRNFKLIFTEDISGRAENLTAE